MFCDSLRWLLFSRGKTSLIKIKKAGSFLISMNQLIRIGEARNGAMLPKELERYTLLGCYQGTLCIGSYNNSVNETVVFGYSVTSNAITGIVRLANGCWPTSWVQKNNLLYVGTRYGYLSAIDLDSFRETARQENLGNAIDAIAVNQAVYFGVNGRGLWKSAIDLTQAVPIGGRSEKGGERKRMFIVSALALAEDNLFVFYASNGNDPLLDGGPAGGLVEVLNESIKTVVERNGTPYGVTGAIVAPQGFMISTQSPADIIHPHGEGCLYELNPSDLSVRCLMEFPASVNTLACGFDGAVLAGLRDGQVYSIKNNKGRVIASQTGGVAGIVVVHNEYFIGSHRGEISRIRK